jgi:hypothetical protein
MLRITQSVPAGAAEKDFRRVFMREDIMSKRINLWVSEVALVPTSFDWRVRSIRKPSVSSSTACIRPQANNWSHAQRYGLQFCPACFTESSQPCLVATSVSPS